MTDVHDQLIRDRLDFFRSEAGDGDWLDVCRRAHRSHRRRVFVVAAAAVLIVAGGASAYVLTRGPATVGVGRATTALGASSPFGAIFRFGQLERYKPMLDQIGIAELAYAPTRAPAHYTDEGGGISGDHIDFTLTDDRFRHSFAEIGRHSLGFRSAYWSGTLATCRAGAIDTTRVRGVQVEWDGMTAWRCLGLPSGRIAKLSATAETEVPVAVASGERVRMSSHLSEAELAIVVASAERY